MRLLWLIGFALSLFLPCAQPAQAEIWVISQKKIRLELAVDTAHGLSLPRTEAANPNALTVLTGGFHHRWTLAPAGLIIRGGQTEHGKAPDRPSRPVIGQLKGSERIVITTATNAEVKAHKFRCAVEAGPFLIANCADWNEFDFEPTFYRPTWRVGVGLLEDGRFFWATSWGTLEEFRGYVRANVSGRILHLILLDGGTSTSPNRHLPTRLIIKRR